MRSQAIENLLKLMIKCTNEQDMENLKTKGRIILDRNLDSSSVLRELLNQKVEL